MRHTATVLTDGRVLVAGGLSDEGEALDTAEQWDIRAWLVSTVPSYLISPRAGHEAVLAADGVRDPAGWRRWGGPRRSRTASASTWTSRGSSPSGPRPARPIHWPCPTWKRPSPSTGRWVSPSMP